MCSLIQLSEELDINYSTCKRIIKKFKQNGRDIVEKRGRKKGSFVKKREEDEVHLLPLPLEELFTSINLFTAPSDDTTRNMDMGFAHKAFKYHLPPKSTTPFQIITPHSPRPLSPPPLLHHPHEVPESSVPEDLPEESVDGNKLPTFEVPDYVTPEVILPKLPGNSVPKNISTSTNKYMFDFIYYTDIIEKGLNILYKPKSNFKVNIPPYFGYVGRTDEIFGGYFGEGTLRSSILSNKSRQPINSGYYYSYQH